MSNIIRPLLGYLRNYNRGYIFSILISSLLVYLPYLDNSFVFDDLPFLASDLSIYDISKFNFSLRWFPNYTLALTVELFTDLYPHSFRIGNILLHALNGVLLFVLLSELTSQLQQKKASVDQLWCIWIGVIFFVCHPIAVYATGYIIQRSILIATLFSLATQLAYIRGLLTANKFWLFLSVLFYFLAIFSKEHSIFLPCVLFVLTVIFKESASIKRSLLAVIWSCYILIGGFLILKVQGVIGQAYEPDVLMLLEQGQINSNNFMLHILSIFTQASLFFKYLFLMLIPHPAYMSIDMREPLLENISSLKSLAGAFLFLLYGFIAAKLLITDSKKKRIFAFAMLYPWLLFLVEFSSIRVQEPFVLYRSYLWLPAIAIVYALIANFIPKGKWLRLVMLILAVLFLLVSWNRLATFKDDYSLWNDAASLLQTGSELGAARIYYNRGLAALDIQKWELAVEDNKRVIELLPNIEQAHLNLGYAYYNLTSYNESVRSFNDAIKLKPDYSDAYFGKALSLGKSGQNDNAMEEFEKACSLGNYAACIILKSKQHN